ncbi:MAG TPA: SUMF1/EgtB/PvdO family nonheme iron enzyme, partial [Methylomirabilota bacterium]|nr:SUMF1/EgtB/PvdO family nonheme iron enzyme [Methylomirabilota bacterium]
MTDVPWSAARSYCHWLGKRLPTALEWRALAFGAMRPEPVPHYDYVECTKGNWGGELPAKRKPDDDDSHRESQTTTCRVLNPGRPLVSGTVHLDRSALGVHDLLGNVAEWIDAGGHPYVAGSHYNGSLEEFLISPIRMPPDRPEPWLGFRCVRSLPPAPSPR